MFEEHHTTQNSFSFAGHTNTHIVFVSVQLTKLTLIIKQVISLKHFTADYHRIEISKITIFLTILNNCSYLPLFIFIIFTPVHIYHLRVKQTVEFDRY